MPLTSRCKMWSDALHASGEKTLTDGFLRAAAAVRPFVPIALCRDAALGAASMLGDWVTTRLVRCQLVR